MLQQLIKTHFPYDELTAVYAYGSKVFPQYKSPPGKQTDLIFIVEDIDDFHKANKHKNIHHYSFIERYINQAKRINNMGARIYYHQNILINNNTYKYGVISRKHFEDAMHNFSNPFICGRFHKPTLHVYSNNQQHNNYYDKLIQLNQRNAFALVALKNKTNVSKETFYNDIINISYIGDIRRCMCLEGKDKSKRILKGAFKLFDTMYAKYAMSSTKTKLKLNDDLLMYYKQLPLYVRSKLPMNVVNYPLEKRKEYIDRLCKIENAKVSTYAALSGVYSSFDISYVVNKYKKRLL